MTTRKVSPWRASRRIAHRRRQRRPYRHELYCCQPRKPGLVQRMFDALTAWSIVMSDVRDELHTIRRLAR